MYTLILITGIFLLLFLIIGITGFFLKNPRKQEMTIFLEYPAELVWKIITDPANQKNWRSDITGLEIGETLEESMVWTEYVKSGPSVTFREKEKIINVKYTIEIVPQNGFSGYSTISFQKEDKGIKLGFLEVSSVPNPFQRVLSYLFYRQEKRMQVYIRDLKNVLKQS